jgi:dihydroorotase
VNPPDAGYSRIILEKQSVLMPKPATAPETLTLVRPDDWHLHLRDGKAMAGVVAATAGVFRRAIVMPNLQPPVTTTPAAGRYRTASSQRCRPARGSSR